MHINNLKLNHNVTINFANVKLWYLIPAILLLVSFFFYFMFVNNGNNFSDAYIYIQKDLFFSLNSKLSKYPNLQFNITQLGDVLISFSLLSVFVVYIPKFWEELLTSAILSLIVSASLKKIFSVPRPAAIFDNDSFVIIGETLSGRTSLPSGHSIAIFVVITTLLFAFMPKKKINKLFWLFFILIVGLAVAFSRVAVGAHYPFDVIIGSVIGYIIVIIGIKINDKIKWLSWIKNKKYYPVFILLFTICAWIMIIKIVNTNLLIFYFSLSALIVTLFLLIKSYVKKN